MSKTNNQNQDINDQEENNSENSENFFNFNFDFGRIEFVENFKNYTSTLKMPSINFEIPQRARHVISVPFIYIMIFPALLLDLALTIYNWTALPLYRIPPVKREDYIVYDRKILNILSPLQKINCLYCSYVNGLFAYASEIAGRTERYWCPLKSSHRKGAHKWYQDFAENPEEWQQKFKEYETFKEVCKNDSDNEL